MGSLVENSPRFCPWKFRAYGNAQQRGAGATPSPWSDYRVFIQTVRGEVSVPSLCAQVAFPLRPALPSIQADLSTSASSEQPKQPSVPAFVDKVFFFSAGTLEHTVCPKTYFQENIWTRTYRIEVPTNREQRWRYLGPYSGKYVIGLARRSRPIPKKHFGRWLGWMGAMQYWHLGKHDWLNGSFKSSTDFKDTCAAQGLAKIIVDPD